MKDSLRITWRETESLIPYGRNQKKHDEKQIRNVANSIRRFGWQQPIVIDRNDVIVIGHCRHKAAQMMHLQEVPVTVAEDLTEDEIRELRIADNKTNESEWDFDALAVDLPELGFEGFDFDFDFEAVNLEEKTEPEPKEDEYEVCCEDVKHRVQHGDVYLLGRHRLMCGDSMSDDDVRKLLLNGRVDLIVTDPPYGINADKMKMGSGKSKLNRGNAKWDAYAPDVMKLLHYADYSCVWGGNYFAHSLPENNDWLCWHKNNDGLSFSEFELAWTNYGRNCRHLTHHWSGEKKLHVTAKPVDVISWAIDMAPNKPNTVADFFGGSGTTIISCEQKGIQCFMMERDETFCDVIIDRWEKLTGQKAELVEE